MGGLSKRWWLCIRAFKLEKRGRAQQKKWVSPTSFRREKTALHTEDVSKLQWITAHSKKQNTPLAFGQWIIEPWKNPHISPLWSSSWLRVIQQLQHYTAAWRPVGRRSRAEQTNYTPVRAVAQHCIIPRGDAAVTLHGITVAQKRDGADEPWDLACVARP